MNEATLDTTKENKHKLLYWVVPHSIGNRGQINIPHSTHYNVYRICCFRQPCTTLNHNIYSPQPPHTHIYTIT